MRRVAYLLVILGSSSARAASEEAPERRLVEATVVLETDRCAGALVGERLVLTAAHCIRPGEREVSVDFAGTRAADGSIPVVPGEVAVVDRARDLALVELSAPAPAEPLAVAPAQPLAGERVYFAGRPDRDGVARAAVIDHLGPCPSLPAVPEALHTTVRGRPGDSGAPLVDDRLQVVGVVHGGAACSIAAPVAGFEPVIDDARGAALQCDDDER